MMTGYLLTHEGKKLTLPPLDRVEAEADRKCALRQL